MLCSMSICWFRPSRGGSTGGIAWRRIWIIGRRQRESETQGLLTRPSRRVPGIDKQQQATGSRQARASNRKTLNLLDRGAVLGVVVQKKRRAGDGWMDMDWGWALSCGLTCRCEKTITQDSGRGERQVALFRAPAARFLIFLGPRADSGHFTGHSLGNTGAGAYFRRHFRGSV